MKIELILCICRNIGDDTIIKVAILNCLKANDCCTGAACLKALNNRKDYFSLYKQEKIELVAFLRCNGCGTHFAHDKRMQEKMERLLKEKVDILHLGICTQLKYKENNKIRTECAEITRICNFLEQKGIQIVRGTHK